MTAPTDKVQLTKWETAAGGGDPTDESGFHEPLEPNEDAPEVQGIYLQPPKPSTARDKLVWWTRDADGNMLFRDAVGETEYTLEQLAAGSAGITQEQHKTLRQLIHFIDDGPAEGFVSGAYKETTPSGLFPTSEVWYTSAAKTHKIVELLTTWSGIFITQEQWKIYDTDGTTVLVTITDAVTYTGAFESSRTRTITVP